MPKAAPYKATDSKGLYLLIQPNGACYWRFRFRWAGKQNTVSCGVYPETGLDEARARRDSARQLLAEGINPSESRKVERAAQSVEQAQHLAAMRFMLDNSGALTVTLGKRAFSLTPDETVDLRVFLDATRALTLKVTPCP
ncbi:hypothetical protein AZSI13_31410 [Azospira sp. I13]|nr:hypothetical protein AZSI13_31410 [Azospira sp. I13]